jgi:catechol 2,3-dioxygenase-like lactoylglutathione lyase family enzyme
LALISSMDVPVLFVEDVARSTAFYRDALGLELRFADDDSAAFALGNVTLIVLDERSASDQVGGPVSVPRATGPSVQLCAFVDDVDAAHAELVARGVTILHPPVDQPWGRRTVFFSDPDGHVWELSQEIAGA